MDPGELSEFTGSPTATNDGQGAEFGARDGCTLAKNLKPVRNKQGSSGTGDDRAARGYPRRRLEIVLTTKKGETELRMVHSRVAADQVAEYTGGWKVRY
ncbi:MAG: hypothetical protein JRN09_06035 [Nitrososphaerota archaeon]|nr:hypothetical protein [Nitrososphaerota archaeon]